MMRLHLAWIPVLALLLAGQAMAGSAADAHSPGVPKQGEEVWGDPEEGSENAAGWTWFGMGYEQRTRAATAASGPGKTSTDGGGSGRKGSGR